MEWINFTGDWVCFQGIERCRAKFQDPKKYNFHPQTWGPTVYSTDKGWVAYQLALSLFLLQDPAGVCVLQHSCRSGPIIHNPINDTVIDSRRCFVHSSLVFCPQSSVAWNFVWLQWSSLKLMDCARFTAYGTWEYATVGVGWENVDDRRELGIVVPMV